MRSRFLALSLLLLACHLRGQQDSSSRLEALLADAQRAQSANDFATAATDYKKALELRKNVPELWANLGLMQHEIGEYAGAISSFEQARRLKPSLYVPNLFLGVDYVHTGRAKDAVPLLLAAEKMNDHDPLPSLTLGRAYSSLGEYRLAVDQLQRTTRIDPKQSSAWFALGIAYLREVEGSSRTMTTRAPDSSYAQTLFAEALVKQSRYKEAADLYSRVLASPKQPECVRAEAGFLYLRRGNADAAREAFETELKENPQCTLALLGNARLQIDRGDRNAASEILHQAWARDRGFFITNASSIFAGMKCGEIGALVNFMSEQNAPDEHKEIADALMRAADGDDPIVPVTSVSPVTGSFTAAKLAFDNGHYQQCAQEARGALTGKDSRTTALLAACSFFSGDDELASQAAVVLQALPGESDAGMYWSIKADERFAMRALARFQQLEPNSARSHILLGDIYRQRESYDDAQKEYSLALNLAPDDPAALLGLASAYLADAKIDPAISTAQKALLKSPDDPETNVVLGEALIAQHNYSDAESHLLKGLNAKPQMLSHVHALLGEAYFAEGRTEEAISQMKMGADSDQDGSLHYQMYRLYSKAGDKADAEIALARMKTLQQQRRKAAMMAVEDSHSYSLDDEP